jgi:pimeloyl-ACP methyl ester carboxylesterase
VTSEGENVMIRKNTLVVVIHGFTRGAKDMQLWKQELQPEFPDVITPDLPTTYASFEECLEKLTAGIMAAKPENYRQVHIAGHSMGGLMAREYLQREKPLNARCLVCVGTPHYGSKLADIALLLPFAGVVWKPLRALETSARKILTTQDIPGLKIEVIASCNNHFWGGRLFLS